MKTIAVLTILFLPGTYISASSSCYLIFSSYSLANTKQTLFAMPLLNWEAKAGDSVMSSRFWIYWALTLPLTLTVVSIWLVWLKREALLHGEEDKEARASGGLGKVNLEEVMKTDDWNGKEREAEKPTMPDSTASDENHPGSLWTEMSILPRWMTKRRVMQRDNTCKDSKA